MGGPGPMGAPRQATMMGPMGGNPRGTQPPQIPATSGAPNRPALKVQLTPKERGFYSNMYT